MAYVKLVFCNEDFNIGIQTINQAIGNLDAVFDGLNLEHEDDEIPQVSGGTLIGHHSTVKVIRDVLQVYGSTFTANVLFPVPVVPVADSGNFTKTVTSVGVGQYYVELSGLSQYWGQAIAVGTSTTKAYIVCRSNYPTTAGVPPGISITCYEMGTGAMVMTDMDFSLTISGTP